MDDAARSVRDVNDALLGVPMHDRLAALCCAVVSDAPDACNAVLDLISVAAILGRQLPPAQRLAVAWHLVEQAREVAARWN